MASYVTAVTDTGAQSCLWGITDFYRCGFKDADLIPVKRTVIAANQDEIEISGATWLSRKKGTVVQFVLKSGVFNRFCDNLH